MAATINLYALRDRVTGVLSCFGTGFDDFKYCGYFIQNLNSIDPKHMSDDELREYEKSIKNSEIVKVSTIDIVSGDVVNKHMTVLLDMASWYIAPRPNDMFPEMYHLYNLLHRGEE